MYSAEKVYDIDAELNKYEISNRLYTRKNVFAYDPKYKAIPAYVFLDDVMLERKYGLAGTDGSWLLKPGYAYVGVPYGDYIRVVEYYYDKRKVGVIRLKEKFTEGLLEYSVSNLEYLQRVVLYTDAQEDIDKIGQITSLEQLDLHLGSREDEEAIRNLDGIGKLENLEEVHTDRCTGVKDLSMFKGLRNLKALYMEYVDVADLNCLKDAEQLEGIGIQATDDIYGFEALENLHQLKNLYLDGYGDTF